MAMSGKAFCLEQSLILFYSGCIGQIGHALLGESAVENPKALIIFEIGEACSDAPEKTCFGPSPREPIINGGQE
jgi:hypothetical protein